MRIQFESLVEKLRINPVVLSEINSWANIPELSKLLNTLRSFANNQQLFLDHYVEVMIARHFISRRCKLEVEVQTPQCKKADLRVTKDNHSFCVHIKRLNLEGIIQKELNVISRLRHLRKISRPFEVRVDLLKRLEDKEIQELYKQVKDFIKYSKVRDKINITDPDGRIFAKCEIFPKSKGKGKNVGVYVSPKLWAPTDRKGLYEKLSDAYKQFMPGSLNVILVTSRLADAFDDFEKSLFDSSGFWSDKKHPDSYMVGWFNFGIEEVDYINFRIWYRDSRKIPVEIRNLFENKS